MAQNLKKKKKKSLGISKREFDVRHCQLEVGRGIDVVSVDGQKLGSTQTITSTSLFFVLPLQARFVRLLL